MLFSTLVVETGLYVNAAELDLSSFTLNHQSDNFIVNKIKNNLKDNIKHPTLQ